MKLKNISYNQIIKFFNNDEYDISYLTNDELKKNLNIPTKVSNEQLNYLEKIYDKNCPNALIFIKHTLDYDYSLRKEVKNNLNLIPGLKYEMYNGNYKYAAVQAGLGQYGKNQLLYNYKFGFDNHIVIFLIWNKIINLPERNKPNYNYLQSCINCDDCFNACPVRAIHNKDSYHWVDLYTCDNFCHFGNDPNIPSIKKTWNKYINPYPLSDEILKNIKTPKDCYDYLGYFPFSYQDENSKFFIQYPICRECTSQKKCSKYNGKYPYQNKIKIL